MATELDRDSRDAIDSLEEAANSLKSAFVAKEELVELMAVCAIAREHLLIVGPPGTAKSELVGRFAGLCGKDAADGNGRSAYFEYLFTRFTEPNEIFGPVDIKRFQAGDGHRRIIRGMLPDAKIAFLDEVFKANSAILNALLTILNERVFYNGGVREAVPLLFAVGAANEVPDDSALSAIYDRFLVRTWTDNVEEARFEDLFHRGWRLEKDRVREGEGIRRDPLIGVGQIEALHRHMIRVDVDAVGRDYREVIRRIRGEGLALSDRRVVKLLKLVAASALRRKSLAANTGDFWVLQHVWNTPEQIPRLRTIVAPYLSDYETGQWRAERGLEKIGAALDVLAADKDRLHTDADYADFLHRAERLRRELMAHGDPEGAGPLRERVEGMVDEVLEGMK